MMKKLPQPDTKTEDVPDAVWGYKNIGAEIGLSASKTRYLVVKTDVLDLAVRKLSHKVIVGSRRRLRDFAVPPS
jgi:hypothetical protein